MAAQVTPADRVGFVELPAGQAAWPGQPAAAAAAAGVFELVAGPTRTGQVIGAFDRAVILAVDTPSGSRVLALIDRAASGVPNGVRVASADGFAPMSPGPPTLVGGGEIRVGDLQVRVVRQWDSRVRPAEPTWPGLAAVEQAARSAAIGIPAAAVDRLAAALRSEPPPKASRLRQGRTAPSAVSTSARPWQKRSATASAAGALLGLGAGLTPGGDDLLAGLLTGWHAAGQSDLARSFGASLISVAAQRTTAISVELLRLAAGGHACLEALSVLRVLGASCAGTPGVPPDTRLRPALQRLLSVGHTSGADLVTGLALGLRHAMTGTNAAAGRQVTLEVR